MTILDTSHHALHGNIRIHYCDFRPTGSVDTRPPVIFVPGFTDLASDYEAVAEAIGRRTVVIELRGHGESDAPESGYSLEDHLDDLDAVVSEVVPGPAPLHLMSFSRGSAYTLAWAERNLDRVLSLSIGDYPGREIRLPVHVADGLLEGRWRGTPVTERLDRSAALAKFEHSKDRPFWDTISSLGAAGVPVLVVRSGAGVPLTDEDWSRYGSLGVPITMVEFSDSPHDIFRPDRTRFPLLVAAQAERGDARVAH